MIFILKETFRGLRRAGVSLVFSLVSMSIGVLLIYLSVYSVVVSRDIESFLKSNLVLHVYLQDSITVESLEKINHELHTKPFVDSGKYISKEAAAEIFLRETGEDFQSVLEYNPLPASFVIRLNDLYLKHHSIGNVLTEIKMMHGVSDVVYKAEMFTVILNTLETINVYLWIITCFLAVAALYIVYATLRLIHDRRTQEIETMKLVGSSSISIRLPEIFAGTIIGVFAAILSGVMMYITLHYSGKVIGIEYNYGRFLGFPYYLLALTGPLMGLLCSIFSSRSSKVKIG